MAEPAVYDAQRLQANHEHRDSLMTIKSVMLGGPGGNPQARTLFDVVAYLHGSHRRRREMTAHWEEEILRPYQGPARRSGRLMNAP